MERWRLCNWIGLCFVLTEHFACAIPHLPYLSAADVAAEK